MPIWPTYIVRDHPTELTFSVAVDAQHIPSLSEPPVEMAGAARRDAHT